MSKKHRIRLARAVSIAKPAEKPAFAIKIAWPTAVIECLCGAGNMMVIVGDSTPVACPACGVKRRIQTDWTMHIGPAE